MHTREHLVLLRPGRLGILVHTLFYEDEVRSVDEFRTDTGSIGEQELKLAHLLVEALSAPFEPAKYKDTYRANLRALIDAKIRGEEMRIGITAPRPMAATDILEALKTSLTRVRKPASSEDEPVRPPARPKRRAPVIAIQP